MSQGMKNGNQSLGGGYAALSDEGHPTPMESESIVTRPKLSDHSGTRQISLRRRSSSTKKRRRKSSGTAETLRTLWKTPKGRESLYVLFLCLVTYLLNQVDRYLIGILAEDMQKAQGWGPGDGTGVKYDLLVSIIFTAIYLPMGIPVSFLADRFPLYRKHLLALFLLVWSASCIGSGASTSYAEVAVYRFILAFAESACTPLAGSIITDFFSKETRATALGVYNWGIYTGFGLAQGGANILLSGTGWRSIWYFFGFAGVVWSGFVLLTIPAKAPKKRRLSSIRGRRRSTAETIQADRRSSQDSSVLSGKSTEEPVTVKLVLSYFVSSPSIVILLIASMIRNAGGYVWAYNSKNFFSNVRNQSGVQQGAFMSWIPILCGSLGSVFGGYISDRYVKKAGSGQRLIVLILSNMGAAPFALLALTIPCPWAYLCLIGSNIIGEMWVGICLALVVELVPSRMKTSALSIYFFIIGLAGFFPVLVTFFQKHVFHSYQASLILLFPGLYAISSIIFFLSYFFMERDKKRAKMASNPI